MLTTAQALETLLSAAQTGSHHALQTEVLATELAVGRVLAQAITSPVDVPPVDVSAMDGYALAGSTLAALPAASALAVSQRIPAGAAPSALASGTVARIFTGAPVPEGADTILIQEDARATAGAAGTLGTVTFTLDAPPRAGQWINRRGADIRAGSEILPAGTRLTPQALGLIASVGVAGVTVYRRLRVALLFTGDELTRPGQPLLPGAIYNSNRYTLGGLLSQLGCDVTDFGIVADALDATRAVLREAAATHDLVLTSGGVSVGEEDHVKPAVEAEGRLDMWKIAMKPGKPLAFGFLRRAAGGEAFFIGLPGNPVSTFVTFLWFVRPFLLRLQGVSGEHAVRPQAMQVRADFSLKGDRRNEFVRVRLNAQGGLDVYPTQSSAVLTSTVWADGLVDNPPGCDIAPGDLVRFIPFAALLN